MKRKAAAKADKMETKKKGKATRAEKLADSAPPEKPKRATSKSSSKANTKAAEKKQKEVAAKNKTSLLQLKIEQPQPNTKEVTVHSKYSVPSTHPLFGKVENLMDLLKKKEQRKDPRIMKIIEYSNFPTYEFELQGVKPDHDKCCICQFEFSDCPDYEKELLEDSDEDIVAIKCSHILHKGCLKNYIGDKTWIRCPVCFTIFGVMIGDQPPGTMAWSMSKGMECDGYPGTDTITIHYSMKSGTRNGVAFHGTGRTAYLPDTPEGLEVLNLLKTAFDRKLIFTVGTSVTTGRDNCVVWNGIHHKTNTHGGSSSFGYPDPTYFQRVKLELAAKGVY